MNEKDTTGMRINVEDEKEKQTKECNNRVLGTSNEQLAYGT
jgi:hypothetical protein